MYIHLIFGIVNLQLLKLVGRSRQVGTAVGEPREGASFKAPVREGVAVLRLERDNDSRLLLRTSSGDIRAREVVLPIQKDGSSTVVPGLHFIGVHFQRKRKSATFLGVGEDALVLSERILAGRK